MLGRVRAAGLRALVYTVNDPDEARRLEALGIDGIVTDAVDRFAQDDTGPIGSSAPRTRA